MTKNRKVKNNKNINKNVTNRKDVKQEFKIVLENENWLRSCVVDNFTNNYKDHKSMAKILTKVMTVLLPDIEKHGYDIFNQQGIWHNRKSHCHIVNDDKFNLIKKIVKKINRKDIDISTDEEKKLWQYGIVGGIRIICLYDKANNKVHPLFIDSHHLIHPSPKYNQEDVMNYKLCPIKEFNENSFT
ncbi:TPA: hypothetical protein REF75_001146 [Staphylococcus pseudintermedius]|uniref:hypothetical protein n=1 Tax=Staphylococcus pseudintermedius TaxID=283734 RepID=UPI0019F32AD1|nr:hypothetical protein [Staphylococcus pseudintermedius]EGQ1299541.1 hypothetical protein [Staphylococcus pseudintermedius]EGQ1689928.1 hypothetical protein [Staphylococcus pseudintermedius]EGQ2685116.1 hypothetical protein [Staphylococcus pseudintermedius]EGQ3118656.1 hypothetical protein [Staphylococcus pseudintermedius]EGQ3164178.1 hypothetical protein [Staphylococcus pseudintermedius]